MRLVLDTNIVVSGLLWRQAPAHLIDAALEGRIELFIPQLIARFAVLAQNVVPASISRVARDPDDDHVLACALAASVDLIVSGDSELLNMKAYQGIPIVSPAEALARIVQLRSNADS